MKGYLSAFLSVCLVPSTPAHAEITERINDVAFTVDSSITGDDYEAFSKSSSGSGGGSLDLAGGSFSWDTTGAMTYCVQMKFYDATASDLGSLILSANCAFDSDMPQTGGFYPIILAPIPNTPPTMLLCRADPSRYGAAVPMD